MRRPLLLPILLAVLLSGGCFHWHKNSAPKENPAIATQMEIEFRQRFVEKRTGELMTQGLTPIDARAQATQEFKTRYNYTNAARQ